jgi:hypothetical protein
MPVQTPAIDIVAMCQRALGANVSQMEAVSQLQAEFRASNLFFRDGRAFTTTAYAPPARQVEIDGKPYASFRSKCIRCGGAGGFKEWPGYTCYRCGGSRYEAQPTRERLYTADEIDRLDAIKAKKDAGRAAKAAAAKAEADAAREARIAALRASEALYADLEAEAAGDDFLTDILDKWADRDLTVGQREAATAAIARIRAKREQAANARHVGTVGAKMDFTGKIEAVVSLGPDAYGNHRRLVRIVTSEGAQLVWFTTGQVPAQRAAVTGTATVKKHDTYNDTAQTIITRAKFR